MEGPLAAMQKIMVVAVCAVILTSATTPNESELTELFEVVPEGLDGESHKMPDGSIMLDADMPAWEEHRHAGEHMMKDGSWMKDVDMTHKMPDGSMMPDIDMPGPSPGLLATTEDLHSKHEVEDHFSDSLQKISSTDAAKLLEFIQGPQRSLPAAEREAQKVAIGEAGADAAVQPPGHAVKEAAKRNMQKAKGDYYDWKHPQAWLVTHMTVEDGKRWHKAQQEFEGLQSRGLAPRDKQVKAYVNRKVGAARAEAKAAAKQAVHRYKKAKQIAHVVSRIVDSTPQPQKAANAAKAAEPKTLVPAPSLTNTMATHDAEKVGEDMARLEYGTIRPASVSKKGSLRKLPVLGKSAEVEVQQLQSAYSIANQAGFVPKTLKQQYQALTSKYKTLTKDSKSGKPQAQFVAEPNVIDEEMAFTPAKNVSDARTAYLQGNADLDKLFRQGTMQLEEATQTGKMRVESAKQEAQKQKQTSQDIVKKVIEQHKHEEELRRKFFEGKDDLEAMFKKGEAALDKQAEEQTNQMKVELTKKAQARKKRLDMKIAQVKKETGAKADALVEMKRAKLKKKEALVEMERAKLKKKEALAHAKHLHALQAKKGAKKIAGKPTIVRHRAAPVQAVQTKVSTAAARGSPSTAKRAQEHAPMADASDEVKGAFEASAGLIKSLHAAAKQAQHHTVKKPVAELHAAKNRKALQAAAVSKGAAASTSDTKNESDAKHTGLNREAFKSAEKTTERTTQNVKKPAKHPVMFAMPPAASEKAKKKVRLVELQQLQRLVELQKARKLRAKFNKVKMKYPVSTIREAKKTAKKKQIQVVEKTAKRPAREQAKTNIPEVPKASEAAKRPVQKQAKAASTSKVNKASKKPSKMMNLQTSVKVIKPKQIARIVKKARTTKDAKSKQAVKAHPVLFSMPPRRKHIETSSKTWAESHHPSPVKVGNTEFQNAAMQVLPPSLLATGDQLVKDPSPVNSPLSWGLSQASLAEAEKRFFGSSLAPKEDLWYGNPAALTMLTQGAETGCRRAKLLSDCLAFSSLDEVCSWDGLRCTSMSMQKSTP